MNVPLPYDDRVVLNKSTKRQPEYVRIKRFKQHMVWNVKCKEKRRYSQRIERFRITFMANGRNDLVIVCYTFAARCFPFLNKIG